MKYLDVTRKVEKVCMEYPNIRQFLAGNVYDLNDKENNDYVAMVLTLNYAVLENNWTRFNCTLFYVDKLMQDRRNEIYIESQGVAVLQHIIDTLRNDEDMIFDETNEQFNITPFRERFSDECSGDYVTFEFLLINDNVCE